MIVVSDTTPLNYLILIGHIDLLHRLYGQVIIPTTVANELRHPGAPGSVREWIGKPPVWLEIRDVDVAEVSGTLLDAGELAALALAEVLHADVLLMDDRNGYEEAIRRNLRAVGTLGVLAEAAAQQLIDLPQVLDQLQQTNFFISPQVLQSLLNRFNKPKP
jgi:predicted nucleic acid-binding protein